MRLKRGDEGQGSAEGEGGGHADAAVFIDFENDDSGHGDEGQADFPSAVEVEEIRAEGIELIGFFWVVMPRVGQSDGGKQGDGGGNQREWSTVVIG